MNQIRAPTHVVAYVKRLCDDNFGAVLEWDAEPEVQLKFDALPGEPRNSDVVFHARDARGPYLVAVEAKADEIICRDHRADYGGCARRRLRNPRSNGLLRIQQLASALFAPRSPGDTPLAELRYQLLTATAGALCEAERNGNSRVVLLVQEFINLETRDENHARNAADFEKFVGRLSGGAVKKDNSRQSALWTILLARRSPLQRKCRAFCW